MHGVWLVRMFSWWTLTDTQSETCVNGRCLVMGGVTGTRFVTDNAKNSKVVLIWSY